MSDNNFEPCTHRRTGIVPKLTKQQIEEIWEKARETVRPIVEREMRELAMRSAHV